MTLCRVHYMCNVLIIFDIIPTSDILHMLHTVVRIHTRAHTRIHTHTCYNISDVINVHSCNISALPLTVCMCTLYILY